MAAPPFVAPDGLTTLLLDAGNTLVFLDHAEVARALSSWGHAVTPEAIRLAEPVSKLRYQRSLKEGASHEDGWSLHMLELCREAGVPEADLVECVKRLRVIHDEFNLWRRVPDGLREALAAMKTARYRLGVVSNSEGRLDDLFARTGLAEFFEQVVDSALEGVRKPDPALFHIALERMGVEPGQAMYAGDIPEVDIVGARSAGLAAVLIDPCDYFPDFEAAPRLPSIAALAEALLQ